MMSIASAILAVTIVAHDPGYYTSLANHVKRWLGGNGIAAKVVTPAEMSAELAAEKFAFLIGFVEPTAGEMTTLRAYRSRGGKLAVFHTASPALGELMGVKPLGFAQAQYPGRWSRMDFVKNRPEGFPGSVLQTSTVLQRAMAVPGKSRTLAIWTDRTGKSTGDAAWIVSSAGYWMTHVLLADGDEQLKAQLLAAMVSSVDPKAWNYQKFLSRERTKAAATREFAVKQSASAGEIHAVWEHSGCGLYPGDWPKTIRFLKESHVTDLFVNAAGAGFAHYPSSVLPRSKTFEREGDQLAAALAAAKGSGIRVHAWMICFNATRSTPDRMEKFRKDGWRLKDDKGRLTEYLDPAKPAVREHVLSAIREIGEKYPSLAGVHLDFVRWYERSAKPKDAALVISKFVAEARRKVRRPMWLTAAVLGKYPCCIDSVGQDWTGWLDSNIVDYVVPMDYTESNEMFAAFVRQHGKSPKNARKIIAGIGVTANESRLDARQVIEQILLSREQHLAGNALFDLDTTLEKSIVPYLKMGVWK